MDERRNTIAEGQRVYEEWRDSFLADPANRRLYKEEAAKKALWLQLVNARQATRSLELILHDSSEFRRQLGVLVTLALQMIRIRKMTISVLIYEGDGLTFALNGLNGNSLHVSKILFKC